MIWVLLAIFQLKHLFADYFLQGRMMLGKFLPHPDYIMPLFCHCLVHSAFTWVIAMFFKPDHAVLIATLDGSIHFIVDRIKAAPNLGGRFNALSKNEYSQVMTNMKYFEQFPGTTTTHCTKPQEEAKLLSNKYFWWTLGLDQMAHHLTDILVIFILIG